MIQEILPKSELLRKYIQSFSILTSDGTEDINYYLFPQIGCTIVLTTETHTKRFENKIQFINDVNSQPKVEIFGRYLNPVQIKYKGEFNEFSIDFTAAGVNYFFEKPYNSIAPDNFQELEQTSLAKLGLQISKIVAIDKKVLLAEQFFIQAFKETKINYVEEAIDLIYTQENISIVDIAKRCNITTRTLNRVFKKYINCSPQTFKKIVRFRKAIDYKLRSKTRVNYTELSYNNNFYDSSHFLREFKAFSKDNPSKFFSSIDEMGFSKFPVRFNKSV